MFWLCSCVPGISLTFIHKLVCCHLVIWDEWLQWVGFRPWAGLYWSMLAALPWIGLRAQASLPTSLWNPRRCAFQSQSLDRHSHSLTWHHEYHPGKCRTKLNHIDCRIVDWNRACTDRWWANLCRITIWMYPVQLLRMLMLGNWRLFGIVSNDKIAHFEACHRFDKLLFHRSIRRL